MLIVNYNMLILIVKTTGLSHSSTILFIFLFFFLFLFCLVYVLLLILPEDTSYLLLSNSSENKVYGLIYHAVLNDYIHSGLLARSIFTLNIYFAFGE